MASQGLLRKLVERDLAAIQKARAEALQAQAVATEAEKPIAPPPPPPVDLPPSLPDPLAETFGKVAKLEAVGGPWRPNPGRQTEFIESSAYEVLFGGSAGGGKLLPLDEPIPTPSGWTTIGELRAGDFIFGRDGRPTEVLVLSAVDPAPESFRLTFDDGSSIEACADHQWLTFDAKELGALTKRTPEWRAQRRARRKSRVSGNKSAAFTASLVARNRLNRPPELAPPAGTVRTTAEIVRTLRTATGRANHAMPVGAALELPEALLPLDPYILGVWLGNGTAANGTVTSDHTNGDQEFLRAHLEAAGFPTTPRSHPLTIGTRGLATVLRALGVLDNKHIPPVYLRASKAQRLALLQGLMDTDGTVTDSGAPEFTNTNRRIAEGVHELVMSLGWKGRLVEGRAKLNGRDMGPKWDLKWTPSEHVFRLPRKRDRQRLATRRTTRFRYVMKAERVPGRPMRCLKVAAADGLFLVSRNFLVTHNSSALLHGGLRHVAESNFQAVYFRRVFPELAKSVIPVSARIFPKLGARYNENKHSWTFPSGATYTFSHLQFEDSVEDHLSAEYQYIAFDELTTFTEGQYKNILSRGRSSSGVPVWVRASTNPGGEGADWVQRRWAPWLGVPPGDPEWKGPKAKPGEVLWYVNEENGERYVSEVEAKELLARWLAADEAARVYMPLPLTRTFIPARIEDNPMLAKNDPAYVQRLMGLDPVRRAQLLHGDWNVRPAPGKHFNRAWLTFVDAPPARVRLRVRHWDLAGTEPEEGTDPDWTVGCKLSIDFDDVLYIEDAHRGQWSEFETEKQVLATAELDSKATHISLPQDPGQAGKFQARYLISKLNGYTVRAERETGSKVERAGPISSQCAAKNVRIVRGPWNEPFLRVLERFPVGKKDDVDALSGAHRYLVEHNGSVPGGPIDLSAGVRQNPWDFTGG